MDSMFEKLMELPLFHGVSYQKISEILGKHRFHFMKFSDGQVITNVGDPSTHLMTIISGSVRSTVSGEDGKVKVAQTLTAPEIVNPDFFFGKRTTSPATIVAQGDCGIMQIEKRDYVGILTSDNVFLFNFLNILSMHAQLSTEGVLALTSGDLRKRIAYWIVALTQTGGTEIVMECRQRDLYSVFGVTRQSLVAALEEMKLAGLLDFSASSIIVTDRRRLAEFLDV